MTRRLLLPLLLVGLALAGRQLVAAPLREHADNVVDYAISVTLDATKKQLAGTEVLTWRNPSSDAISELWFHLYLNAFKGKKTSFYKESGGKLRGDVMVEGKWGWTNITALRLFAEGTSTDLTPGMRFDHPDDQNADDETVMRVPLPSPVPAGGSVRLFIAFTAQLPQVFARTGYLGNYFLVGQWFPKIGVYEPVGVRGRTAGGWNCHQFHADSEFYADFGHYRVDITVPRGFVVGATGRRLAEVPNGDSMTYAYEQDDVHDFGWTADARFIEVKDVFSATTDVTPAEYEQAARLLGRDVDDVKLSDVQITLLLQPEHRPQLARQMHAIKAALKHFGLWYGRYPYATLTVVDPAEGASGSGGMEYPTFVTGETSSRNNHWPFSSMRDAEQTIIHEIGHQWWYGMVASNEFEEAWLDEGVNSYSTQKVIALEYGANTSMGSFLGLPLADLEFAHMDYPLDTKGDRVRENSWKYSNSDSYAFNSYFKPELLLETLDRMLGAETMARVMRAYSERWRFRHPASDDLYAVASEVAGRDLLPYFKDTVEGTGYIDFEVVAISTSPGMGAGVRSAMFDSRVEVRRQGGIASIPVDLELRFAGLPPRWISWTGDQSAGMIYAFHEPAPLESAELDPDHRIVLDVNWLNNAKRLRPDHRVAVKWTSRWLFWIQNLLACAMP